MPARGVQALLLELFAIVCGEEEVCGEDSTILEKNPGHAKGEAQRAADCERVRAILASGAAVVSPNVSWTYGETLLYKAIEYDFGHPAEMVAVLLEARADPNAPNALGGERPLESPWLEDEDDEGCVDAHRALFNAQKRALLQRHGADPTLKSALTRGGGGGWYWSPRPCARRPGPSVTEVDDEEERPGTPGRRSRRAWW